MAARHRERALALDAVRAFIDSVLPDALKDGDVTVYTTLDLHAQRAADRAVLRQAADRERARRSTPAAA